MNKITTEELVDMFGPGLAIGSTILPNIPLEGLTLIQTFKGTPDELRAALMDIRNRPPSTRSLLNQSAGFVAEAMLESPHGSISESALRVALENLLKAVKPAHFETLDRRWKMSSTSTHVYFVGGPFSQWYRCSFEAPLPFEPNADTFEQNITSGRSFVFNCAEQFMMAAKASLFDDSLSVDAIMKTTDPAKQKAIGRAVRNFDPDRWNSVARQIVTAGSMAKFTQNPELRDFLLMTGEKILVEGAHYDPVWGVKLAWDDPRILDESNWQGTNWLGQCLTEVRRRLRTQVIDAIHPGHQR